MISPSCLGGREREGTVPANNINTIRTQERIKFKEVDFTPSHTHACLYLREEEVDTVNTYHCSCSLHSVRK